MPGLYGAITYAMAGGVTGFFDGEREHEEDETVVKVYKALAATYLAYIIKIDLTFSSNHFASC